MDRIDGTISFTQRGVEGLDSIADLWWKLTIHHKERAPEVFKSLYDKYVFEGRKKQIIDKARSGDILVVLATDKNTGKLVGYCVSTVSEKNEGELDSIYIEKEYRKKHIGNHFMKTALKWMDDHRVNRKIIGVAVGNEEAFGFYQKYGFYPRVHILQQADTK
jgi:diamine N-acetyltransferase